jgi:3-isopropylmalate/(R)-2-methylmalate dehydratase small subunit
MRVSGAVLPLPFDDIDTDQIIPAVYLTGVDERGMGEHLFEGRIELAERLSGAAEAKIVVTLENFGCGSSREHAVWALRQRGFQAVVARSFSRIFSENAYNNGLVPIVCSPADVAVCMQQPSLDIDVEEQTIVCPDGQRIAFALDPLRKLFLLEGGYLNFVHARIEATRAWAACRA